jgi:hypothetical protein
VTRVTISGNGSYNVYVKVSKRSRRSSTRRKASIVAPIPIAKGNKRSSSQVTERLKQRVEQLVMDL